mmetsp:Transcript_12041/g.38357  ORF Transcript_12041/g.38357 Transcript_12041/m.38357 type:complete len:292 (+) Transcript_12041:488-1363(+)
MGHRETADPAPHDRRGEELRADPPLSQAPRRAERDRRSRLGQGRDDHLDRRHLLDDQRRPQLEGPRQGNHRRDPQPRLLQRRLGGLLLHRPGRRHRPRRLDRLVPRRLQPGELLPHLAGRPGLLDPAQPQHRQAHPGHGLRQGRRLQGPLDDPQRRRPRHRQRRRPHRGHSRLQQRQPQFRRLRHPRRRLAHRQRGLGRRRRRHHVRLQGRRQDLQVRQLRRQHPRQPLHHPLLWKRRRLRPRLRRRSPQVRRTHCLMTAPLPSFSRRAFLIAPATQQPPRVFSSLRRVRA